jgi:hypothetical protein
MLKRDSAPRVVKEMPGVQLDRTEFERRFRARFDDPVPRAANTLAPRETSKTFRLAKIGQAALEDGGAQVDFLDLSVLTSEYGRVIEDQHYPSRNLR